MYNTHTSSYAKMEEFPVIFVYKNDKTALTKVIRKE